MYLFFMNIYTKFQKYQLFTFFHIYPIKRLSKSIDSFPLFTPSFNQTPFKSVKRQNKDLL